MITKNKVLNTDRRWREGQFGLLSDRKIFKNYISMMKGTDERANQN